MPKPAPTSHELELLKSPDALQTLELLRRQGWLQVSAPEAKSFFSQDEGHPAKAVVEDASARGGKNGAVLLGILMFFGLAALVMTSFVESTMPPYLFVLWTLVGVSAGLMVNNYPKIFERLLPSKS